jgi:hypothetical protein
LSLVLRILKPLAENDFVARAGQIICIGNSSREVVLNHG